jgi:hypothetical protein
MEYDNSQNEWSTEDLNKIRVSAGKLTEQGTFFVPKSIEVKDGKNGEFWVVSGETPEGKPMDLTFSSMKLHKIFEDHWEEMEGQCVVLIGKGMGFDREYLVRKLV